MGWEEGSIGLCKLRRTGVKGVREINYMGNMFPMFWQLG